MFVSSDEDTASQSLMSDQNQTEDVAGPYEIWRNKSWSMPIERQIQHKS